jgi:hypothetical protein
MTLFTRPSMAALLTAGLVAMAGGVSPGWAQSPAASARAPALQSLLDCRAVAGDAQRLACFDKAAAGFGQAEAKGEVVVVDRDQVRQASRQSFGFNFRMPEVFTRGEKQEDLDRISAVAARAYQGGDGKWTVELEDGAVWRQIDSEKVSRAPRKGSKVEIRKAAMGSFFMNLDGQRAVRAQRSNGR